MINDFTTCGNIINKTEKTFLPDIDKAYTWIKTIKNEQGP